MAEGAFTPAMKVVDMLCTLGPRITNLEKIVSGPPGDLYEAVRILAATGDRAAFVTLPPVLMHCDEQPTAQKLWGGLRQSAIPDVTYKHGPAPLIKGERLLGATILTLHDVPHAALVYVDGTRVVARVYDTPMSALESELYAPASSPTPLELKWKGPEFASAHLALRESTGGIMQAGGMGYMPGYLFTEDNTSYHLVRPGPVPFLYMREPETQEEYELVENLIHAALIDAAEPNECSSAITIDEGDALFHSIRAQVMALNPSVSYAFETVFSRAPHPGYARWRGDDHVDRIALSTKIAKLPVGLTVTVALLDAGKLNDQFADYVQQHAISIAAIDLESSEQQAQVQGRGTLSNLTDCSSRLCTVRQIGTMGLGQGYKLASAVFAASDVGLAVRELQSNVIGEAGTMSVLGLMWNMADRIDEREAMLCVELGPGRDIRSLRLINSANNYVLDLDSAGRLLECPWVTVVAHLTSTQEPGGFFTIEVSGVERCMLTVCDAIRKTYGLEAQRHVRPVAAQAQIDYDELDKRIKATSELLGKMQEVAKATPSSWQRMAAPPPPTSAVPVHGTPYTSPELERLKAAQKKWSALGKRVR